eukprot:s515_g12.t1
MQPGSCNKCKTGKCKDGDSWCLGCSSLEATQELLKKRWAHPGLRAIAEESSLNAARYTRALFNLDSTLGTSSRSGPHLEASAKSKVEKTRSGSPPDTRPPIRRALPREPERREREKKQGEESEDSYTEESEEEEERVCDQVKEEEVQSRERSQRRTERVPEPPRPPARHHSSWHHSEHQKKRRRRRGGSKHQQHKKSEQDPLRTTEVATSVGRNSSLLSLGPCNGYNADNRARKGRWIRQRHRGWRTTHCRGIETTPAKPAQAQPAYRLRSGRGSLLANSACARWISHMFPRPRQCERRRPPCSSAGPRDRVARCWDVAESTLTRGGDSRRKEESRWLEDGEDALHLGAFKWYPPGDFQAEWLTKAAKGWVVKGKEMEVAEQKVLDPPPRTEGKGAGGGATSTVEQRLSALRRRGSMHVTFADNVEKPSGRGVRERRRGAEAGIGGALSRSSSQQVPSLQMVKKEIEIVSETDAEKEPKKKKRQDLGETLAKAAKMRAAVESRKEKKRSRSRSRSKKRHKRRRRKSSSGSDSGSRSSKGSVSSDSSLMAPLKRRSKKAPGSVYKMLEEQARDRLAADGIIGEESDSAGVRSQRPKLYSYYQIILKPGLEPKSRDNKELAMLSRTLDLLRDGRLTEVADVLAARMIAVHTATNQGWNTARHLEILGDDDDASAPAHVLLSAQRHARQLEKAGGKGSWNRGQTWGQTTWNYEPQAKGKNKDGKNKGKKGKGKGKGQKGNWPSWGGDHKEGAGDKPKRAEGES